MSWSLEGKLYSDAEFFFRDSYVYRSIEASDDL